MSDDDDNKPTPGPEFDLAMLDEVRATLSLPAMNAGEQRGVLYALTGVLTRILHREQQRSAGVDGGEF